jgi:predicted acyltransferase
MATLDRPTASPPSATGRLLSIDALRGFDMFWIIGGEEVVKAWADWGNWPFREQIDQQLDHVPWEGFHFYDLIFPLFLFVVGLVLPFSLGKLQERGEPRAKLYGRVLRRTLLLFVFGLLFNHVLMKDMSRLVRLDLGELRVLGVLQRIAIAYGVAGLIVLNTRVRGQVLALAAILVGYWALLAWVPAPGFQAGDYSIQGNLSGYVDRTWLPGRIVKEYYGYGDNEGLLSTIPAIGTALLGVLAGQWLRGPRRPSVKFLGLLLAGAACLAAGWYWSYRLPIIKNIWTSSFVLWAGGWSLLLLALFYAVIDVLGFRRWAFFFVVIGANAITIYLGQQIIDFHHIAAFFMKGIAALSGSFQAVLWPMSELAVKWVFLWFLYRHRIFLRV